MQSALFEGFLAHSRFEPIKHQFRYPLFMLYLDLDEIDDFFGLSKLWSREKLNWASFRRGDYLSPDTPDLKQAVANKIQQQTGNTFHGNIRMLTNVRYFGYCFNPVTFYFCFSDSSVDYIVAEINNTPWGERHAYVLEWDRSKDVQSFSFKKTFHVSPFNPMDMEYQWQIKLCSDQINIKMETHSGNQVPFKSILNLKHKPATTKNLNRMLVRYPATTLKTIFAIYWQALKLKFKGATFYDHPDTLKDM